MTEPTLREIIGDPQRLEADLQKFHNAGKLLSSLRMELLNKYPNQWVGLYEGEICADAPTLEHLLAKLDELRIPRKETVVRYVDQIQRRMILYRMIL